MNKLLSRTVTSLLAVAILVGFSGGEALSASPAPSPPPASTTSADPVVPPVPPVSIRVGLGKSFTTLKLTAEGSFRVVNAATNQLITTGQGGQLIESAPAGSGIRVAGKGVFTGPIRIVPGSSDQPGSNPTTSPASNPPSGSGAATSQASNPAPNPTQSGPTGFVRREDGRRYRGEFEVFRNSAGLLTLVNVVPLEDYLLGVVPREMPPSWPAEALKAQAVAARTYALYQVDGGKYEDDGFDVVDTTDSQVYGGVNSEDPRSNQAVWDTKDQIVTYNGKVIDAFFHASSGGYTENSENVFSAVLPYIRGVPDFDQDFPGFNWTRAFTLAELEKAFSEAGYNTGALYAIAPIGPKGVSGRYTAFRLAGSSGSLSVKSSTVRGLLGLRSTLFEVLPHEEEIGDFQRAYQGETAVSVAGGTVTRRSLAGTTILGAGGVRRRVSGGTGVTALGRQKLPGRVEFVGRGWGHGLGLSQWGARGMALKGYKYNQILSYYYSGTVVTPRSNLGPAALR